MRSKLGISTLYTLMAFLFRQYRISLLSTLTSHAISTGFSCTLLIRLGTEILIRRKLISWPVDVIKTEEAHVK
jgi:hypothetical protein